MIPISNEIRVDSVEFVEYSVEYMVSEEFEADGDATKLRSVLITVHGDLMSGYNNLVPNQHSYTLSPIENSFASKIASCSEFSDEYVLDNTYAITVSSSQHLVSAFVKFDQQNCPYLGFSNFTLLSDSGSWISSFSHPLYQPESCVLLDHEFEFNSHDATSTCLQCTYKSDLADSGPDSLYAILKFSLLEPKKPEVPTIHRSYRVDTSQAVPLIQMIASVVAVTFGVLVLVFMCDGWKWIILQNVRVNSHDYDDEEENILDNPYFSREKESTPLIIRVPSM